MIINIEIDSKDLSAINTLDYFCNNEDNFEIVFKEKEEYYKELEKKKSLKIGDVVYLSDFRTKIIEPVLTIEHRNFDCILNGIQIPYSSIIFVKC